MDFFFDLCFTVGYYLYNFDELLTIFFTINFFMLTVWSSIFELLWPTQFFNRRNNIFHQSLRFRALVEFNLKLNNINFNLNTFYKNFINYFFNKC